LPFSSWLRDIKGSIEFCGEHKEGVLGCQFGHLPLLKQELRILEFPTLLPLLYDSESEFANGKNSQEIRAVEVKQKLEIVQAEVVAF
jgi:hypothetical protein